MKLDHLGIKKWNVTSLPAVQLRSNSYISGAVTNYDFTGVSELIGDLRLNFNSHLLEAIAINFLFNFKNCENEHKQIV